MNLAEMIEFVRQHADTDATDAPDANLTVYARAAYNDIKRRVPQWNDNRGQDTLTTVAGVTAYPLASTTYFSVGNLEYVTSVSGPSDRLIYIPWSEYLELKDGTDVDTTASEPWYYTVRNATLYLYPDPAAVKSFTVYGYTKFSTWPSGSDEPDLPREFDEPICWYMLAKYFLAQEDVELARMYMADYEQVVNRFIAYQMRSNSNQPRVKGGLRAKGRMTYRD